MITKYSKLPPPPKKKRIKKEYPQREIPAIMQFQCIFS